MTTGPGLSEGPAGAAVLPAGDPIASAGLAGGMLISAETTPSAAPRSSFGRWRAASPLSAMIAQRLGLSLLLLLAVSVVLFLGVEALPGDFAQTYLGQSATPQAVENIRRELGLDQPAITRYFSWLGHALQGDFGLSWASRNSIAEQIGRRLGNTLFLAFFAALVSVPLAVGLGMVSVLFRDRLPDRLVNIFSLAAISLPEFFVGYVLIFLFAIQFPIVTFPSTVYDGMPFLDRLGAILLPGATLVLVVLAHMLRMTRAAILNVMEAPYIETAELKGLSRWRTIVRHAAPNAIAPIINVVALNLAYLVVGVVVVEVVFVYPGIGQYMVDAVTVRDMPVVQACGLLFAGVYIFLNMLADILAIVANPRLRHPR
ncbi:ABC transporter permease [Aureimonas endophytica]|uniref:ABC transporter permease n=1 Tax=Aureimonas endophytica TaxID=2027858 RepID=A0A916ZTM5_9HYPH|nr:ABC transporter permease [Aureimonas endophytica]